MMINKNELNKILQNMRIAALTKEQYENILNMMCGKRRGIFGQRREMWLTTAE